MDEQNIHTGVCHNCGEGSPEPLLQAQEQSWGGVPREILLCVPCYEELVDPDSEPEPYDPYHEHPWPC